MTPIHFPESNHVLAKNQPEYRPLPVFVDTADPSGQVVSCWQLSWREWFRLLFTRRRIWCLQMTFHNKLQPQLLQVEFPFEAMETPDVVPYVSEVG